MSTDIALELRAARRKAGLTQGDIAQLLHQQQSQVSDMETGRTPPGLVEIMSLSLIYGRSFERFFGDLIRRCQADLRQRLESLIPTEPVTPETFNRTSSLKRLRRRLDEALSHDNA